MVSLIGVSCGDDDGGVVARGEESTTTAPSTTTTTSSGAGADAPPLTHKCGAARYQVAFPQGWSTNPGDVAAPCRYFHPAPFEVPVATEFLDVAVIFDVEAVPFERMVTQIGQPGNELLSEEAMTIAGQPGLRVEARSTGGALLPAGVPSLRYLVTLDGSTLIASTFGLPGLDHQRNRAVLDAMVRTLELKTEPGCSAADLPAEPAPQTLPADAAETRRQIVAAATACDFARLAELGQRGAFTYSFGNGGDPAAYWRQQEAREDPMRVLVELLNLPPAEQAVPEGKPLSVWPRAYAYEQWSDVPPEARDELQPLYGPDEFEQFDRFGSYTGYRVGIDAAGDWLFFVAGD